MCAAIQVLEKKNIPKKKKKKEVSMTKKYRVVIVRYQENLDWLVHWRPSDLLAGILVYNKNDTTDPATQRRDQQLFRRLETHLGSTLRVEHIPNLGREGYTFLRHFESMCLADTTAPAEEDFLVIMQGSPFDHLRNLLAQRVAPTQIVRNLQTYIEAEIVHARDDFAVPLLTFPHDLETWSSYPNMHAADHFRALFDGADPHEVAPHGYRFAAGCQYLIPLKKCIFSRPAEFYALCAAKLLRGHSYDIMDMHHQPTDGLAAIPFDPDAISGWCMERIFPYLLQSRLQWGAEPPTVAVIL